jgi:hypothetical protein
MTILITVYDDEQLLAENEQVTGYKIDGKDISLITKEKHVIRLFAPITVRKYPLWEWFRSFFTIIHPSQ